jgi:phosphate transport system permease protein
VGIAASIVPAPIGVLAGIYLAELVGNGPFPHAIRFFNDVLTGLPFNSSRRSKIIVVISAIVLFPVWAGSFALSIILIRIVVRVTEKT